MVSQSQPIPFFSPKTKKKKTVYINFEKIYTSGKELIENLSTASCSGDLIFVKKIQFGGKMLSTVLIIILILLLLGAIPAWPYSAGWGYGPSGVLGIILLIVIILLLMGRI